MRSPCPTCGSVRNALHAEAVRRAKIIIRIARGAGLLSPLKVVVTEQLAHRASCQLCRDGIE